MTENKEKHNRFPLRFIISLVMSTKYLPENPSECSDIVLMFFIMAAAPPSLSHVAQKQISWV